MEEGESLQKRGDHKGRGDHYRRSEFDTERGDPMELSV